ncbi:MAG: RCC1 domain-containing protein, partial [Pseudanabaena sp.]
MAEEGIFVWGQNNFGQLGTGNTTPPRVPEKITSLSPNQIVDISFGNEHSLAATIDGELYSWGRNNDSRLGQGVGDKTDRHTPTRVSSLSHVKAVQVSAGQQFSVVLTSEGQVFSFGQNDEGQLGHGDTRSRDIPEEIKSLPSNITFISVGAAHSLALTKESGEVWAWGQNTYGQIGAGHNNAQLIPVKVSLPSKIISIACGGVFSGALSEEGKLFLWGYSGHGELGQGSTPNKNVPQEVPLNEKVIQFTCGYN